MKMATSGQPPMDAGKRPSRLDTLRLAAPQPKSLLQTALLRIRFYRLQILWTLLFFLFQAFLVGMGVLEYYEEYERVRARRPFSVFNLVAYAFGSVIRVNAAVFLLFPAYRGILSYLRRSVLSRVVPFDSWILFHMIVAYTTGVCVVIHVGCFVAHFYRSAQRPDAIKGNRTVWTYLFKAGSVGSEYLGATNISGWVMVGALLVMFVCSLPPVRHSRFYDLFYWTHKLQFVFWAALIVHEPIFWRVFVAFCVLLLAEKARVYFNAFRWACQPVHIRHVTLLPAQVARITLNRPSCFSYNPGDYVFLRIPSLGLLSWHPFTLTSSPDNKETISFHVKAAGNWTRRLPKRLQASSLNADDALSTASLHASSSKVAILELDQMDPPTPVLGARDPKGHPPTLRHSVLVNGPYASSSTNLRWTRHALLVAGGIGVTPLRPSCGACSPSTKS
ncbi:NADPH oxidase 5-like [Paramacrobiotus metropolitanus]|uniref:NADPH oxidase 5-like n=1 Tax=Paramacrobiotus metropolitanus TaxID=2943436 RepID=UPI0024464A32|nr:NADPH oxidase 5-like [Paramacrobiotus metropolitanus]